MSPVVADRDEPADGQESDLAGPRLDVSSVIGDHARVLAELELGRGRHVVAGRHGLPHPEGLGRRERILQGLGADGIWVGTRFIATPEARSVPGYKEALVRTPEDGTVISRAFTGKTLRAVRNKWTEYFEQHPDKLQPFPAQAVRSFQEGAMHLGGDEDAEIDPDNECYPAGQGVGAIHEIVVLSVAILISAYLWARRPHPKDAAVLVWLAVYRFAPSFFFEYLVWGMRGMPFFLLAGSLRGVAALQALAVAPTVISLWPWDRSWVLAVYLPSMLVIWAGFAVTLVLQVRRAPSAME